MSLTFHILKESGRLNKFLPTIEKTCKKANEEINQRFFVKNVDIIIMDNAYGAIPIIGVGGHTYTPHVVIVSLNPSFPQLSQILGDELLDTVAHEVHHAVRWQSIGYGENLLEAMVSEGLADHFAREITGRIDLQPWDRSLSPEQLATLFEKAKGEYLNKEYNHSEWFFGSEEKQIPGWTAYALGFELVSIYLKKHPESKASNLYNVKAEVFL